jgi:nitrate reductase gamma subunit
MSDRVLFAIAPYVAALVFLLGMVTRMLRDRQTATPGLAAREGERSSAAAGPRGAVFRAHQASATALILLFVAHVAMWIAPDALLTWNEPVTRAIAVEAAMLLLGLVAGIGLARVIAAVLRATPARLADVILLGVLAVAIASGLAMAARYRWASTWSAVTLTPYVRSLFTLTPELRLVALPYLVKLHVFSGIVLLAVVPFTSVAQWLVGPIQRVLGRRRAALVPPHNPSLDESLQHHL